MTAPRILYFIDRGHDKPEHHKAPYHRYLLCTDKNRMIWESGWTGDGAWVWSRNTGEGGEGWLLLKWNGLIIDYGHLVRGHALPDGAHTGFWHPHKNETPWKMLPHAVWWSGRTIPMWLCKLGVDLPPDDFSRDRVKKSLADLNLKWG